MSWDISSIAWDDFMNTPLSDEEQKIIDNVYFEQCEILKKEREMSEKLDNWFTHHPPSSCDVKKYKIIRDAGKYFANIILENTPPSADQSDAIRKVREAVMTANASIACGGK